MKKQILVGLGVLSLTFLACTAETMPDETPATDESEEALAPALVGVAACLADPPCAIVVGVAIGYAVKSVADLSGEALGAAQRAAARWQDENGCNRAEVFKPQRTDQARGCFDKKGVAQCYSTRHSPCAGVHSHGSLEYNEIRGGRCVRVNKPKAIRCEGPFQVAGACSGATTLCGVGGTATSGTYVQ